MTVTDHSPAATLRPTRGHPARVVGYAALAVVGLVGTWWLNLAFITDPPPGMNYLQGWFANAAAASAAVDLLVVSAAACMLLLVEAHRLGWSRWAWLIVPVGLMVAMAFSIPAFLAVREWALLRAGRRRPTTDHAAA